MIELSILLKLSYFCSYPDSSCPSLTGIIKRQNKIDKLWICIHVFRLHDLSAKLGAFAFNPRAYCRNLFCYILLFSVLRGSHFNALKNETAALDSAAIHLIAILCEILNCQRFVNLARLNNIPAKLSFIVPEDC